METPSVMASRGVTPAWTQQIRRPTETLSVISGVATLVIRRDQQASSLAQVTIPQKNHYNKKSWRTLKENRRILLVESPL